MIEKLRNIINDNPKMTTGIGVFVVIFMIEFCVMYLTAFNTEAFERVYYVSIVTMIGFIVYSLIVMFSIIIKK